jgi:mRNA interferase YafQ
MYRLEFTNQYLKDLKLARKRNFDEDKLNKLIELIISGEEIPVKFKNHILKGNFKGFYECHVTPDWLLIYSKQETIKLITLIRTGTHSDLF